MEELINDLKSLNVIIEVCNGCGAQCKGSCPAGNHLEINHKRLASNGVLAGVMPSLLSLDFKKMRKDKGLTLREVEEITGVSNPYLSQLETGKIKSPGYDVVKVLYDLYSDGA